MLTKDEILNAQDTETQTIKVKEWGGEVTIAVMSGFARDKFEASIVGKNGTSNMSNIRSKLVASSIVDEKGDLMFTDADIIKLGKKSSIALDRIFTAAQSLNKITDDDVDELAKN
ncbi:MAG: hypothetical protein DRQ47_11270 [Gammaproteobacteria bacterium]|nr:MAG: hypothetical protein DRQ47_11270 [Gammaproteobacteria bacterium]